MNTLQAKFITTQFFKIIKYNFAIRNCFNNFGIKPFGDITQIDEKNIPSHDIICGGFPCQAFSYAGKRLGLEDARGTLFYEFARVVKEVNPPICIGENVKGLRSRKNVDDELYIDIIKDEFNKIGSIDENFTHLKFEYRKLIHHHCKITYREGKEKIYIFIFQNTTIKI